MRTGVSITITAARIASEFGRSLASPSRRSRSGAETVMQIPLRKRQTHMRKDAREFLRGHKDQICPVGAGRRAGRLRNAGPGCHGPHPDCRKSDGPTGIKKPLSNHVTLFLSSTSSHSKDALTKQALNIAKTPNMGMKWGNRVPAPKGVGLFWRLESLTAPRA